MAKKINFGMINADSLKAFSAWNVVDVTGTAVRSTAKQAVTTAQATLDALLASRAQAMAAGMSADDAIRKYSTVQAQVDLEKAQNAYKDTCADLRNRQVPARALIPADLYKAYVLKNQSGDFEPFVLGVREFLVTLGLDAPAVASEKFAETICARIGRKNATGKAKTEGHKSADLTKQAFADRFIREFLEFCLIDKGVLDQAEDGTLSLHNFDADTATDTTADATTDAKTLFRTVMKEVHPDNTGVDNDATREFMFRAVQNRDDSKKLTELLTEIRAYFQAQTDNQAQAA